MSKEALKAKFCKWVPFYGTHLNGDATIEQQCQEYRRTGEAIIKVIDFESYESLRSELDSMIEGSNHLSTHNAELDLEITELESKLEFMNKNCISLGLHDSRVQALEQENERLLHFQPNTLVVKIKELEQENKRIESLNSKLQLEVHDQDMKIIELEQLITQVDKYGKEKLITELDEELTISEKKLEKAVEQRNLLANSVLNSDVQVICADIDIMILDEQIASIKGSGV